MNEFQTENNYEELKLSNNNFEKNDNNNTNLDYNDKLINSEQEKLESSEFENNNSIKENIDNIAKVSRTASIICGTSENMNEYLKSAINSTSTTDTPIEKNILKINNCKKMSSVRKDFYGQEIVKGGKYKITFADDVYAMKNSANNNENEDDINHDSHNSLSKVIRSKKKSITVKGKTIKDAKQIKRIKTYNQKDNERYISHLVQIINIESFKEYTKENYIESEIEKKGFIEPGKEDAVCCSAGCMIF